MDHVPAVIVRCENVGDVQAAVRAAMDGGLSLSVRGGGHDWGGAASMDVAKAAGAVGLAPVTSNLGAVGMTGLTLGGGYGPLTVRFGLSCDNLVGAEVMTAGGEGVWTDETQEPNLLWALRSGGGNLGIVTAIRMKLHLVTALSAGTVAFSWDQAASVAVSFDCFQPTTSDGLTLTTAFAPDPNGNLALTMLHAWCGDPSEDDDMLRKVTDLGKSATANVARTRYVQMLKDTEALRTRHLRALLHGDAGRTPS